MDNCFYLKINERKGVATVKNIQHPHHQVYHITFADGYENIFFTDVETGNWLEEDLGETALAAACGAKIGLRQDVCLNPLKELSWYTVSTAYLTINFGIFTFKEGENTIFELYADNHKFLCNLVKNKQGKWIMFGLQGPFIAHEYVSRVQVIIGVLADVTNCR